MTSRPIDGLFDSETLVHKVRRLLPSLFYIAEVESRRGGKTGMEVGFLRERVVGALLVYAFGAENVEAEIPTTSSELDLRLFGRPFSIKTITGSGGVKAVWTVRDQGVAHFLETYKPSTDMILVRVKWGGMGSFTYIPLEAQLEVFQALGRARYLKVPGGNNPRGVEYSREALARLERDRSTRTITVEWKISDVKYDPIRRWLKYWETEDLSEGL